MPSSDAEQALLDLLLGANGGVTPAAPGASPYDTQVDPEVSSRISMALDHYMKPPGKVQRGVNAFAKGYYGARPTDPNAERFAQRQSQEEADVHRHVKELMGMAELAQEHRQQEEERRVKDDQWRRDAHDRELVDVGTELGIPEARGHFMPRAALEKLKAQRLASDPSMLTGMDALQYEDAKHKAERRPVVEQREDTDWQNQQDMVPLKKRGEQARVEGEEIDLKGKRANLPAIQAEAGVKTSLASLEQHFLELQAQGKGPGDPEYDKAAAGLESARGAVGGKVGGVDKSKWDPQEYARFHAQHFNEVLNRYKRVTASRHGGPPVMEWVVPAAAGQPPSIPVAREHLTKQQWDLLQAYVEDEVRKLASVTPPGQAAPQGDPTLGLPEP